MITPQEVEQYIRLTFKQYGLCGYKVVWRPNWKRVLGAASPWEKQIELSPQILGSFDTFKHTLLHEVAHILQFDMMGGTYQVNGRNNFHGKVFKEACKIVGIEPSLCVPRHFPLLPHSVAKQLVTK
jgi:predicted SprT family Zn-dependent metalloprotease